MDDDAMFRLDKSITTMLKKTKENRKERRSMKIKSEHFRVRIANLLEIFAKSVERNSLVFTLFVPLMDTVTNEKIVSKIFEKVVRKICTFATYPKGEEFPLIKATHLLVDVFERSIRPSPVVARMTGVIIGFVMKAFLGQIKEEDMPKVEEVKIKEEPRKQRRERRRER